MNPLRRLLQGLAAARAVLVEVESTQGSAPREAGTWMAVFADRIVATIGGGRLEFDAVAAARALLAEPSRTALASRRYALGPSLGQCCGGVVVLRYTAVDAADIPALRQRLAGAQVPVALFGGGHVGAALARVLASLPFSLTWIDSRDEIFPPELAEGDADITCEHSDPVQAAVPGLAPGSRVLIMSFSHAEDLDVVAACLQRRRTRGDLPFIGLIGSHTKWATFRGRLRARGFSDEELAAVTCPIGVPGITGKEPEVIAVAVAAQLLQTLAPSREA
ncbi:xanthine dehydrogenase accessory protein XdhC [Xylophilus sp. GOD-11R]|uniref:xanthine dehydrogenase accessory protein XdhC n=1 Tax=Xylophilus sp. GOD-11R TaxID=3089814 RepID=UPI00298D30B9|nr:xanthine dehydrogenase accessory protein XdhC [Xylophilus sp. GOD-11R]WPB57697.1 xanthine dehydrogenase accessory protein XdhC [Xylophilus sp. GOD-11R]